MSTLARNSTTTLQALYRANIGILRQKLDLLANMKKAVGPDKARILFSQPCPLVKASMGQHLRHSMDHLELVAALASTETTTTATTTTSELHYDLRKRGGNDETDMGEAEERMRRVERLLLDLIVADSDTCADADTEADDPAMMVQAKPSDTSPTNVDAFFMLSGDPQEFQLSSTIPRELGFAAHHAIHHLAMVKIIALESLQLPPETLPADFGKAPSTIVHEHSEQ